MRISGGTIETKLVVDSRQFDADIKKAESTTEAFAQTIEKRLPRVSKNFDGVTKAAGLCGTEAQKLEERLRNGLAADSAGRALQSLAKYAGLTEKEFRDLEKRMGLAAKELKVAGSASLDLGKALKSGLTGLAAYFSVREIGAFGKELFDVGQKAAQMNMAFKEVMGSAKAGQKELEYLRTTAGKLGQNFYALTDDYKKFLAANNEAGMSLQDTHKIFEATTKAGASLGLSSEKVSAILNAMAQMASKGTVSMEELRQQMGDALPGAFGMAAKAMGMTTAEFAKAVEQGEILWKDLGPKLADVMGTKYTGEINKATAAQNAFNMAWEDLKVSMANSGFLNSAAGALQDIGNTFKDENVKQGMRDVAALMGQLISLAAKMVAATPGVIGFVASLAPGSAGYYAAKAEADAKKIATATVNMNIAGRSTRRSSTSRPDRPPPVRPTRRPKATSCFPG